MTSTTQQPIRPWRRRLFLLLTLLLVLVFLEFCAVLWFAVTTGSLSSVQTRLKNERNSHIRNVLKGKKSQKCTYRDTQFPHPYLGFVSHGNAPCGDPFFNGQGFKGRLFPSEPSKKDFVILLTGGSVAHQLAHMAGNSDNYLEVYLNHFYKSPKGGRFVVLNGGQGAWKQPQSAILYLLNWQNLDGVITLDGFNEWHYLFSDGHFNQVPSHFMNTNPALSSGTRHLLRLELNARLFRWNRSNALASRSHLLYGLLKGVRGVINQQLKGDAGTTKGWKGKKIRTSVKTLYQWPKKWPWKKRSHHNFRLYKGYIRAIRTLALSRKARTAHFLQPVAGFGKSLTPSEKKAAGNPKEYVDSYRKVVKRMMELKKEKIPMVSLLQVFANTREHLYADIVHCRFQTLKEGQTPAPMKGWYYSKGYDMMAKAMAKKLGSLWKLEPKKKQASSHPTSKPTAFR